MEIDHTDHTDYLSEVWRILCCVGEGAAAAAAVRLPHGEVSTDLLREIACTSLAFGA